MPKYVRRQSWLERLKSALNPWDFALWLSEEIESHGWDQLEKEWAIPIAIGLNLIFIIARANVKRQSRGYDDVFGDLHGQGWLAWLATLMVHTLTLLSLLNTLYTFSRKKHYRLFETSVDEVPSTPSAHRVRVDSSPVSSSPLQFLSKVLGTNAAQSRAHPDPTRDVWQVAVWDPSPLSLRLFCYFSPGHIILYWLFLPTLSTDPRPSVTVVTTIILAILGSSQLSFLSSSFSQQSKDSAFISKEVLHEYDTKYVRPRTQPLYRDVGTQFSEQASYSERRDIKYNKVETFTPMVVINRGFRPNPNPNYTQHVDPDNVSPSKGLRQQAAAPIFRTPASSYGMLSPTKSMTAVKQPIFRPSAGSGDGGSLGVYSHAQSPLRKTAASSFSPAKNRLTGDGPRERIAVSPERRPRMSVPGDKFGKSAPTQNGGHPKNDLTRRQTGYY